MLKTAARLLLLRFLPRRIVPIVTVVEALLFVRSIRKRSKVKVNPPTQSRTAPPDPAMTGPAMTEPVRNGPARTDSPTSP